jgi:hypothetical protein
MPDRPKLHGRIEPLLFVFRLDGATPLTYLKTVAGVSQW